MIRMGILGFTHSNAWKYAAYLKRMANVEITGVFDDRKEIGDKAALEFGTNIIKITKNY